MCARKIKKPGWLYGTWVQERGTRMTAEMPVSKFIGLIYKSSNDSERQSIMDSISKADQVTIKE